jgi:zinc protease
VIVHEDHSAPLVSVNTWYHVGSGRERPGRTGFAHLFEHIMFEGSMNVPEGAFDQWLEAVGGSNNGSTNGDRTNYWENAPAGAVELPLFLESDRMGHLLEAMSPQKVDGQRDVVKNERRQSYENRPTAWRTWRCRTRRIRPTIRTTGRPSAPWRTCPPPATRTWWSSSRSGTGRPTPAW